jgi:nitrile hydratase accessory protein
VSDVVRPDVRRMAGAAALPRDNGELVFDAPWQGRVLAMALAVVEQRDLDWDDFRRRLIAAIAADPTRPYYESWTAALTDLVVDLGVVAEDDLDGRLRREHAVEPVERAPIQ